jgi:hypothetical protein
MKVLVLRTHGGSSSARARTAILGARAAVPETRDTEFSWEDFVERNNNELVATWGSLGQRPWVHGLAVVCLQALQRGGAGAGRVGCRRPRAAGKGGGWLSGGRRPPESLQVPCRAGRGAGPGPRGQRLPGPQGALVPDQGGSGRRQRPVSMSSCAPWTI